MKPLRRIGILAAITALLVSGPGLLPSALASIYAYTASDGTVNLSNVPADDRYELMVRAPLAGPAVPEAGPPPPTIAQKALYNRVVDEVARTYGLDSALLHAVISVESRYKPKAVSRKGAAGLMQLMPAIARRYGVTDPLDPVQNLHGGAKHLRHLLKAYDNDVSLALAAYNSGENRVDSAIARCGEARSR